MGDKNSRLGWFVLAALYVRAALFVFLVVMVSPVSGQVFVEDYYEILENDDLDIDVGVDNGFGGSIAWLGDLDGDGGSSGAVACGVPWDETDTGGAVWILFLDTDGTVYIDPADDEPKIQKISEADFAGLDEDDAFGGSIAWLGDLDGDAGESVGAIAVGAPLDDDACGVLTIADRGAVWILFLEADGTIYIDPADDDPKIQKISACEGDFEPPGGFARFGCSVAAVGDINDDDVVDLAVSSRGGIGTVWILFLSDDGTVSDFEEIGSDTGGFGGDLDGSDRFGSSLAPLGDLDENGVEDLAVGAMYDDDGDTNQGAVWILFLTATGTVLDEQKISDTEGSFDGEIENSDQFGASVANLGDVNGDGVVDLGVGARYDDDGGTDRGAVWLLYLLDDGTVDSWEKISDTEGGFSDVLEDDNHFGGSRYNATFLNSDYGGSIAALGDLNDDGFTDIAVGAPGRGTSGSLFVLFLTEGIHFLRGDVDGNGQVLALLDALYLLEFQFLLGDEPPCMDAADVDDSGVVFALIDALLLLQYAFSFGPEPPAPGPDSCGPDETPEEPNELLCETATICP